MSDNHPLDNPAWSSLNGNHKHLGAIGKKAARYDPQISMIGSVKEDTDEAFDELAELAVPGIPIALPQSKGPEKHAVLRTIRQAEVYQMVRETHIDYTAMDFEVLTAKDVPLMLELVEIAQPGPISPRTIEMGRFIGLKVDGKLVAMGGERMNPMGYVEITAICTHPDYRGKGIAKAITGDFTNNILDRGLTPFLHVHVKNKPAIKLYEKLGYKHRAKIPVTVVIKPSTQ